MIGRGDLDEFFARGKFPGEAAGEIKAADEKGRDKSGDRDSKHGEDEPEIAAG